MKSAFGYAIQNRRSVGGNPVDGQSTDRGKVLPCRWDDAERQLRQGGNSRPFRPRPSERSQHGEQSGCCPWNPRRNGPASFGRKTEWLSQKQPRVADRLEPFLRVLLQA